MLWEKGILGDKEPKQLMNTVLYLIGLHFALGAVDKYKSLKTGVYFQFKVKYDYSQNFKYLEYHEYSAKNNQGGLKSLNTKQKVAVTYENTANPEHCLVHLYELYLSKRPSHDPKCLHDLYLHPLSNPKNPHV